MNPYMFFDKPSHERSQGSSQPLAPTFLGTALPKPEEPAEVFFTGPNMETMVRFGMRGGD